MKPHGAVLYFSRPRKRLKASSVCVRKITCRPAEQGPDSPLAKTCQSSRRRRVEHAPAMAFLPYCSWPPWALGFSWRKQWRRGHSETNHFCQAQPNSMPKEGPTAIPQRGTANKTIFKERTKKIKIKIGWLMQMESFRHRTSG
jgi:hypothetical protein